MKKIEYKTNIPEFSSKKYGNALFLDIETTGFHRERETVYLIGAGYAEGEEFIFLQWFCDDGKEETILRDFFSFSKSFHTLIHYNGLSFDLPFLEEKAKKYKLESSLLDKIQLDLYREIRPLKNFLNLKDLKLPTVEAFFLENRQEDMSGKTLIPVYQSYLETPSEEKEEMLRKHNYYDIIHLTTLTGILDLKCCLKGEFMMGESFFTDQHLRITLNFQYRFPKLVQGERMGVLYSFYGERGELNIPLFVGSLRYYYKNYKDYFFLPYENMVIHKSVAAYVDSSNKEKCTAENCFTMKEGIFMKQYEPLFETVFKQSYKEKDTYFSVEEYQNSDKQYDYIKSVIRKIADI